MRISKKTYTIYIDLPGYVDIFLASVFHFNRNHITDPGAKVWDTVWTLPFEISFIIGIENFELKLKVETDRAKNNFWFKNQQNIEPG